MVSCIINLHKFVPENRVLFAFLLPLNVVYINFIDGSHATEYANGKSLVVVEDSQETVSDSYTAASPETHQNNYDEVAAELTEWFHRNSQITHVDFSKVILKLPDEEASDFVAKKLLNGYTEEGNELLPYVKEFLRNEEQQIALRKSLSFKELKEHGGELFNLIGRNFFVLLSRGLQIFIPFQLFHCQC